MPPGAGRPLRVCLDLTPAINGHSGIGRYARELALALTSLSPEDRGNGPSPTPGPAPTGLVAPERLVVTCFVAAEEAMQPDALPAQLSALPRRQVSVSLRRWRWQLVLDEATRADQDRLFADVDVFHATHHALPRLRRPRSVITLHDVTFALFPETHTLLNRSFQRLMVPRFLHRADAVIAVSESTRRDAVRLYGLPVSKISVIHEGVSPHFRPADGAEIARIRTRYGMATPYILFVGTIEPRKNLGALVQAFQRVANELEDVTLVIAGNLGWHYEDLLGQLGEPASGPRIYRPGRIPEGDLRGLYSGAAAVVLPSLYEGFGLPALEAMACGTPVVASNRSSLPEVVGDAAILVPPRDVDALARGLLQVLRDADLAERLSRAGRRQAGHFTWDRAARETLAVYRGVAAGA